MRRAQDRARNARFRKNGAQNATIKSRALGALKLASCALSARLECAREAGRFFYLIFIIHFPNYDFNHHNSENIFILVMIYIRIQILFC